MQGQALRGLHTGGRCFGYRSIRTSAGVQLDVNEEEAEIVRRIFRLYGQSGYSLKRIAHTLNGDGVLAPQPQAGRFSRSWCVSSVRHILRNQRYAGKTVWNTKRKVRVPGTGKRVYRARPESECDRQKTVWTRRRRPGDRTETLSVFRVADVCGMPWKHRACLRARPSRCGSLRLRGPSSTWRFGLQECDAS
jgi:hypothetical protein